ncbi:MAG: 4-hydroxy-tetrahydrodipicolinate reductase [Nanoarchaeota archaeon]|nr:4-hydroxy-tetrahydrodipicolinate reductase [Nanoarchaeota archaeon]
MKIALIGYGKMGKEIQKIAVAQGMEVVSTIDPLAPDAMYKEIDAASLEGVDVCIDFTHPSVVVNNIKKVAKFKKNIVVGTTGWYEHEEQVRKAVNDSKIGFICATNFSLGVNIFLKIVQDAAKYFDKFPDYDVAVFEEHHNKKADSPSGTAKTTAQIILDNMERKTEMTSTTEQVRPEQLHVVGLRCGAIPGEHVVVFDSEVDTVRVSHSARSRSGFAFGAVKAAEWIKNKKGYFTIDNMMEDIIKK